MAAAPPCIVTPTAHNPQTIQSIQHLTHLDSTPAIPLTDIVCGAQGSAPIDMNTGNPPNFLERTYTDTQPECFILCHCRD